MVGELRGNYSKKRRVDKANSPRQRIVTIDGAKQLVDTTEGEKQLIDTTNSLEQRIDTTNITNTQPVRLLGLAAELHNITYTYVLQNEPRAYLIKGNSGKLFSKSSLVRVNSQVREEFGSLLQAASPELIAEVKNFDFAHVVTFLNRLAQHDLANLPTSHKPAGRRMRTILIISIKCPEEIDWSKLQRWLNRLDHPHKKGSAIDFEYKAVNNWDARDLSESLAPIRYWSPNAQPPQSLSRTEKEKLKMALAFREEMYESPFYKWLRRALL